MIEHAKCVAAPKPPTPCNSSTIIAHLNTLAIEVMVLSLGDRARDTLHSSVNFCLYALSRALDLPLHTVADRATLYILQ